MSINETQYRINIDGLQNALKMIHSTPQARLEIEPDRVALVIQGEYAWIVHGDHAIADVLARTVDRYYEKIDDAPVEPVIPIPGLDSIEQVVREMPFAYQNAIGRIFQGDKGWGGEFTFKGLQVKLPDQFAGPEEVAQELRSIIDAIYYPFLAPDIEEDAEEDTEVSQEDHE